MYCAVLNHTLRNGFRRTTVCATTADNPEATMGHGWAKSSTDAINGIKATDVPSRANDILDIGKNDESHAIPSNPNAMRPFQYVELVVGGTYHS